ncbi:hypothetical protein FKP32DRAFT_391754 [Trametes sanguinea]|nr:hypothetical protein FKP32DRAFT_391754 [Trametes sanguinea]
MAVNTVSGNMCRAGDAALSILKAHYPIVLTLQCYLHQVMRSVDVDELVQDGDSQQYKTLVSTSYVASAESPDPTKHFVAAPPMSHMRDVIDRAQERLFLKARGGRPSSIITAGYRKVTQQDDRTRVAATRMPLVNYFVNTIITALQGHDWELLLNRGRYVPSIDRDLCFRIAAKRVSLPVDRRSHCQHQASRSVRWKRPRGQSRKRRTIRTISWYQAKAGSGTIDRSSTCQTTKDECSLH